MQAKQQSEFTDERQDFATLLDELQPYRVFFCGAKTPKTPDASTIVLKLSSNKEKLCALLPNGLEVPLDRDRSDVISLSVYDNVRDRLQKTYTWISPADYDDSFATVERQVLWHLFNTQQLEKPSFLVALDTFISTLPELSMEFVAARDRLMQLPLENWEVVEAENDSAEAQAHLAMLGDINRTLIQSAQDYLGALKQAGIVQQAEILNVSNDGNSFYLALATELAQQDVLKMDGTAYTPQELRKAALDYLCVHFEGSFSEQLAARLSASAEPAQRDDLVENIHSLAEYIEYHGLDGAPADSGIIAALAEHLQLNFEIHHQGAIRRIQPAVIREVRATVALQQTAQGYAAWPATDAKDAVAAAATPVSRPGASSSLDLTSRNDRWEESVGIFRTHDGKTFNIVEIPGDGNCFYRAVAFQLARRPVPTIVERYTSQALRQAAADYILQQRHEVFGRQLAERLAPTATTALRGDLPAGVYSLEDYVAYHRQDGVWADPETITALARVLQVPFNIYQSNGKLMPVAAEAGNPALAVDLYYSGNHYHALLPRSSSPDLLPFEKIDPEQSDKLNRLLSMLMETKKGEELDKCIVLVGQNLMLTDRAIAKLKQYINAKLSMPSATTAASMPESGAWYTDEDMQRYGKRLGDAGVQLETQFSNRLTLDTISTLPLLAEGQPRYICYNVGGRSDRDESGLHWLALVLVLHQGRVVALYKDSKGDFAHSAVQVEQALRQRYDVASAEPLQFIRHTGVEQFDQSSCGPMTLHNLEIMAQTVQAGQDGVASLIAQFPTLVFTTQPQVRDIRLAHLTCWLEQPAANPSAAHAVADPEISSLEDIIKNLRLIQPQKDSMDEDDGSLADWVQLSEFEEEPADEPANSSQTPTTTAQRDLARQQVTTMDGQHFEVMAMAGDGNCFYHAVADQLSRQGIVDSAQQEYTHQFLRQAALDYINVHRDGALGENLTVALPVLGDSNLQEYVARHRNEGAWADEGTMRALASHLQINLVIHQANQQPVLIAPEHANDALPRLNLWYTGNHYDSLWPVANIQADETISSPQTTQSAAASAAVHPVHTAPNVNQPVERSVQGVSSANTQPIGTAGNCFYQAVAEQLSRRLEGISQDAPLTAEGLRTLAVQYIEAHSDGAFAQTLAERISAAQDSGLRGDLPEETHTLEQYVAHHRQDCVWVDSGMVLALAQALNVTFRIHQANAPVTPIYRSEDSAVRRASVDLWYTGDYYRALPPGASAPQAAEVVQPVLPSPQDSHSAWIQESVRKIDRFYRETLPGYNSPIAQWGVQDIAAWASQQRTAKLPQNFNLSEVSAEQLCQALAVMDRVNQLATVTERNPSGHRLRDAQKVALRNPSGHRLRDAQKVALRNPSGHRLRDAQKVALLVLLRHHDKGHVSQINTGEGKTTIVAIAQAIRVLQGYKGHVITSNNVLAADGVKDKALFYSILGLNVAHNNPNSEEPIGEARACYRADIVYGSINNFQFDYLRHSFERLETLWKLQKGEVFSEKIAAFYEHTWVMLDEIDSLLIDQGGHVAKLSGPFPGMECLRYVYLNIWAQLATAEPEVTEDILIKLAQKAQELKGSTLKEDERQTAYEEYEDELREKFLEEAKKKVCAQRDKIVDERVVPNHLRTYVQNNLERWAENAFRAKHQFQQDVEYKLVENQEGEVIVVPVDNQNTGVSMQNTILSHGIHQFLQIKHNLQVTYESLTSCFISNLEYIKKYGHQLSGVTGTLGSYAERRLLAQVFTLEFSIVPPYKPKKFTAWPGLVVEDSQFINTVTDATLQEMLVPEMQPMETDDEVWLNPTGKLAPRAVLIVCASNRDVQALAQAVRAEAQDAVITVKIRTYADEADAHAVEETLDCGDIVIATNLGGRGTDFKTTETLEAHGGLHVIEAFLPCNQRVQDQGFGRTARQGHCGSAQMIVRRSEVQALGLGDSLKTLEFAEVLRRRDAQERERLATIQRDKLLELEFNDQLFNRFSRQYGELKEKYQGTPEGVNWTYALRDLKEKWAFWLEGQGYTADKIRALPGENTAAQLEHAYQEFVQAAGRSLEGQISYNPFYAIQLAERYLESGARDLTKAKTLLARALELGGNSEALYSIYMKLFEVAIEDGQQILIRYAKAVEKIFCIYIPPGLDSLLYDSYKLEARKALKAAKAALLLESDYLSVLINGTPLDDVAAAQKLVRQQEESGTAASNQAKSTGAVPMLKNTTVAESQPADQQAVKAIGTEDMTSKKWVLQLVLESTALWNTSSPMIVTATSLKAAGRVPQPVRIHQGQDGSRFEVVPMPGDGNCFYHAVADQLRRQAGSGTASQYNHSILRQAALAYIALHPEEQFGQRFVAALPGLGTFATLKDYIKHHAIDRKSADEDMVRALAAQLDRVLVIHRPDGQHREIVPTNISDRSRRLHLLRSGNHYDSLKLAPEASPVSTESAAVPATTENTSLPAAGETSQGTAGAPAAAEESNLLVKHLNARLTCLGIYRQHLDSLLVQLDTLERDGEPGGIIIDTKAPKYLNTLGPDENQKTVQQHLTPQAVNELESVGMGRVYQLKKIHDVPQTIIITAQGQIGGGFALLALAWGFPPLLPVCGPLAGALISEGITDIVMALIDQGNSGFNAGEHAKSKVISYGISLLTMGLGAIASSTKILTKAMNACRALATKLRTVGGIFSNVCKWLADKLDKLADYLQRVINALKFAKMNVAQQGKFLTELKDIRKLKEFQQLKKVMKVQDVVISHGSKIRQVMTSSATQAIKGVAISVAMENIFTATLNRIMIGIQPGLKTRAVEAIRTKMNEPAQQSLFRHRTAEQLDRALGQLFVSSLGDHVEDVAKGIALGVLRHSSNWKMQLATLSLETVVTVVEIDKYTNKIFNKYLTIVAAQDAQAVEQAHSAESIKRWVEQLSEQIASVLYGKIVGITGKLMVTLPKALYRGYKEHREKQADMREVAAMEKKQDLIENGDKAAQQADATCVPTAAADMLELAEGSRGRQQLADAADLAASEQGASLEDAQRMLRNATGREAIVHDLSGQSEVDGALFSAAEADRGMVFLSGEAGAPGHAVAVRLEGGQLVVNEGGEKVPLTQYQQKHGYARAEALIPPGVNADSLPVVKQEFNRQRIVRSTNDVSYMGQDGKSKYLGIILPDIITNNGQQEISSDSVHEPNIPRREATNREGISIPANQLHTGSQHIIHQLRYLAGVNNNVPDTPFSQALNDVFAGRGKDSGTVTRHGSNQTQQLFHASAGRIGGSTITLFFTRENDSDSRIVGIGQHTTNDTYNMLWSDPRYHRQARNASTSQADNRSRWRL